MPEAKKSLSQNFLVDKNISKKIIELADIKNNIIVEIGPGYGILTDFILKKKPKKIYLIEKDNNLSKKLTEKYKYYKNIEIINADIMKIDLLKFGSCSYISNLPYNVSVKIILYLFSNHQKINEMIFMLQKEVALKFDYKLNKMNKYKFLSKIISNYKRCFNVPSTVFKPKPKITSTVVKFTPKKNNVDLKKAKIFCNELFKNKRKKIKRINFNKKINDIILDKRAEELSTDEILCVYNSF